MNLSELRKDESWIILGQLDDKSLFNYCLTNKSLCPNEEFWKLRFIAKYGKEAADFKNSDRSWKKYYLLAVHYDEKYFPDKALEKVAEKGYFDLVQFFIKEGANKFRNPAYIFNSGLEGAIRGGY